METFFTTIAPEASAGMVESTIDIYEYPALALAEYVSNAADEPADRRPVVTLTQSGSQVRFAVQDFAAGITAEVLRDKVGNIALSTKGDEQIGGKGIGTKAGLAVSGEVVFRSETAEGANILILRRGAANTLMEDERTGVTGTKVAVTFDSSDHGYVENLIARLVGLQATLDFELQGTIPTGIRNTGAARYELADHLGLVRMPRFHPAKQGVVTVQGFNYACPLPTHIPSQIARDNDVPAGILLSIIRTFTLPLDPVKVTIPRHREHLVDVDAVLMESALAVWETTIAPILTGPDDKAFAAFRDLACAADWDTRELLDFRLSHADTWSGDIRSKARFLIVGRRDPLIVTDFAALAQGLGLSSTYTPSRVGVFPVPGTTIKTPRSPDALALARAFAGSGKVALALDTADTAALDRVRELVTLAGDELRPADTYTAELDTYRAYKTSGRTWPGVKTYAAEGALHREAVDLTLAEWRGLTHHPHVEFTTDKYLFAGKATDTLLQAFTDTGITLYTYNSTGGTFRAEVRQRAQVPSRVGARCDALAQRRFAEKERRAELGQTVKMVTTRLPGFTVPQLWLDEGFAGTKGAPAVIGELSRRFDVTELRGDDALLVAGILDGIAAGTLVSSWGNSLYRPPVVQGTDPLARYVRAAHACCEPVRGVAARRAVMSFLHPDREVDTATLRVDAIEDTITALLAAIHLLASHGFGIREHNVLDIFLHGTEYVATVKTAFANA